MSMTVKKGDTVVVITGKEKGKTGKVLEVFPENNRVLVDGVNVVSRHQKARNQQEKSGIVKKSAPLDASNVMVVCPSCGKATRVHHKVIDGKKVRVCKCGVSLDKAYVKATKKDAKKAKADTVKEQKTTEKVAKTEPKTVKNAVKTENSAKAAPKVEKPAEKKTTTKAATKPAAKPAAKATATKTPAKAAGTTQKSKTAKKDA